MSSTLFFHFLPKQKPVILPTFESVLEAVKGDGFVWLDFNGPTGELLQPLVDHLGVHPLTIEDCLGEHQIPKLDVFQGNSFVLFNSYAYDGKTLTVEEIDFIISPRFLVTVHGRVEQKSEFFTRLPERIERVLATVTKGTDFLMHAIMDYVVDQKFVVIEKLEDELEAVERQIHDAPAKFKPQELMRLRGHMLALRKSLFHEREVVSKLCRKDAPCITDKSVYYFRDIYDHLTKFFEFVEINREMVSNLFELYLSARNNHLTEISLQMNEVMKRLTLITTIFMPLTLLSGIGGMSEYSAITGGAENWVVSYSGFMIAMVVLGWLNYKILKWKKWV